MKQRTGFVSNSSSSSFILKFNTPVTKPDDLKPFLAIPGVEEDDWDFETRKNLTLDEVAEYLFRLLKPFKGKDIEKLLREEFNSDCISNKQEKDRYEQAITARWDARDGLYPILKKHKIKYENNISENTYKNITLFNIEYGRFQLETIKEIEHAEAIKTEIEDKYIPIFAAQFKNAKYMYQAEIEDHDTIGSMLEHEDVLSPITIAKFSHH